jgi:phosphohistidine phosphatase
VSEGGGRTLVVLRHAKAAQEPGLADEDRPLTGRGRRDAAAAGAWLREAGLIPGLVLCSPARRTRETWQHLGAALAGPGGPASGPAVTCDRRLYTGDATGLLGIITQTPAEVGVLLLVGHNPASHQLVYDLSGECESFPTAALAVIGLPGGWAGAAPGAGTLTRCWSPRG